MDTEHLFVFRFESYDFHVGDFCVLFVDGELERRCLPVVDLYVVLTVSGDRFLLGQADIAVLYRREDSRGNVAVVCRVLV